MKTSRTNGQSIREGSAHGRRAPIDVSNPVPEALRHYELEVLETLGRAGLAASVAPTLGVEGRRGIGGKISMLGSALLNGLRSDASASTVQLWPSLGLLDPVVWASSRARNAVVMHDPVPIRKQFGYGRLAQLAARTLPSSVAPVIITHSDEATLAMRKLMPRAHSCMIPHPIRNSQRRSRKSPDASVLVAGQYKPERNLELLSQLGPLLTKRGVRARIVGRGWPAGVDGWDVEDRFVPEPELDDMLSEAWCVLVPYRRFFQSGVAIRALELGTVSVLPETGFGRDLFGADSGLLVSTGDPQDFLGVLLGTLERAPDAGLLFDSYKNRVDDLWRTRLPEALSA